MFSLTYHNKLAIFAVIFLYILVLTSQFPEERVVNRFKKDNSGPLLEGDEESSSIADQDHGGPEQEHLVEDENGQDEVAGDEKTDEDYDGAGEEQTGDGAEGDVIIREGGGYGYRNRQYNRYRPYNRGPEVVTVVKGN